MKKILKKFNDGEYLVKIVEPGFLQFMPKFFWIAFALFYVAGIGYLFYRFRPGQTLTYVILVSSFILLIWYARFIKIRLSTYFLITSDRLIHVGYRGLFKKDIIELHYNQFKTISCHFRGILSSLFRIGKIVIDRGGLKDNIVLKYVRHPQTIQDIIMKLQREYTYARQFGGMEGNNNNNNILRPMTGEYLSAKDLLLFLHKIINIEDRKRIDSVPEQNENKSSSYPQFITTPNENAVVNEKNTFSLLNNSKKTVN